MSNITTIKANKKLALPSVKVLLADDGCIELLQAPSDEGIAAGEADDLIVVTRKQAEKLILILDLYLSASR